MKNDVETLAEKLSQIALAKFGRSLDPECLQFATIARDHFAISPPMMPDNIRDWLVTRLSGRISEADLVALNIISPRPVPTPGDRFAATIDLSEEVKADGEIAKLFDAAVGPLLEYIKGSGMTADDLLADFEARIGEGK